MKNGTVKYTLFNNKKKGNSCKVVSRYAHAKIGASGFGVSSSGSASINLGKKYDYSSQLSKNVTN